MADISFLQTRGCLMWVTERPRLDFPRESSNFWLLGHEWKFLLTLYSTSRFYRITLHKISNKLELQHDLTVSTYIRVDSGETCLFSVNAILGEQRGVGSFTMESVNNALGSDPHRGKWTIVFVFRSKSPLMLHMPSKEKDLSEDKCVQASLDIPPDLESLSDDFHQLLKREIFPDVTVRCEGRNISAHRSILGARSEVFNAMFRNKMAESETGTVDVTDLDSDVLDLLLQYVYSGKIPDLSYDTASSLYEAADKYSIHALKKSCSDWMVRNLTSENCLGYLVVADAHSDEDFKERVMDFVAENLKSVKKSAWSKFNKDHSWLANSVYQKLLAPTLAEQV